MRTTTLCCAALVMGCASTTAPPALPTGAVRTHADAAHEAREREEANRARAAARASGGRQAPPMQGQHGSAGSPQADAFAQALARGEPPPLVAFVEHRPTWCNGALCLKLVNDRHYPIKRLWMSGQRVQVQSADGLIWPGKAAYIRLFKPGRYSISAHLVDVVQLPNREVIPTDVVVERRALEVQLPGSPDADGTTSASVGTITW